MRHTGDYEVKDGLRVYKRTAQPPLQRAGAQEGPQIKGVENPRRLLENLLARYPEGFWQMNDRLPGLRQQAKDILADPASTNAEVKAIYIEIGQNRQNERNP
jgi:hypothetical protein